MLAAFPMALAALLATAADDGDGGAAGLRVPPGFEVIEYAGPELANDIQCMTIDPKGRIVVSGRGYIRILVDENNDGRADRALPFSGEPADGAMGMLWEGDTLYFTGGGGLRRLRDANGDGRADGPSQLIRAMRTGSEHGGHAIRRGPDGWLYVIGGNNAEINRTFATGPASPIVEPVAGAVVRFAPDFRESEIVADGFRNPYDFDFGHDGELYAYDSDNERCVSLPWYEPTRFYRVIEGAHHGWLNPQYTETWRQPPYFFDVAAPLCTLERGSPTGVECYKHAQFPREYRGGFFLADWTFGRVWFVNPGRVTATDPVTPRVFLEAQGADGFAPTDLAVHPKTGDLFISVGGRGTRGAVYRVRYPEGLKTLDLEAVAALQPKPRPRFNARFDRREARIKDAANLPDVLERALALVLDSSTETRLQAVRLIQIALGDLGAKEHRNNVWEGYAPRRPIQRHEAATVGRPLRTLFPTGSPDLDRELARTLGMIADADPDTLEKLADQLRNEYNPIDDEHYLIVISRLKAPRTAAVTNRVAAALLRLDAKLDALHAQRDRNWPLRIGETYAHLATQDANLNTVLIAHPDFGRAEHALFALAPGFDHARAATIFLDRAKADPGFRWNADLVGLIAELPAERSLPALRSLWGQHGLNEAILPALAKQADIQDRDRFLEGLNSSQIATIRPCLDALERLPRDDRPETALALVKLLNRLTGGREETPVREQIARMLKRISGRSEIGMNAKAWNAWLAAAHPELAAIPASADGVDIAAWKLRLDRVTWSSGDAERGRLQFTRAGCEACHNGGRAIGPDLAGVTGRFSRDDLFTAILQPSRDVSPRYQATVIATRDGHVYQGIIIYDAVDGLILQTGAATTVRVAGDQIDERRAATTSVMPSGLLDPLGDAAIADLHAYLQSLGKPAR